MAMEYAQTCVCPVCASCAAPTKPLEASVRPRPFGFNKVVRLDLQYLKDATQKNHVALSTVDDGTGWHTTCLLKNNTPEHVAKKLLALWLASYGGPELLVVDQSGEFEGAFIAMCEEYSIDARAAAPWQRGLATRARSSTIW